jgi:hypothetical protein
VRDEASRFFFYSSVRKFLILLSGRKGGDTSDADQEQGGPRAFSHEHRQVYVYFIFFTHEGTPYSPSPSRLQADASVIRTAERKEIGAVTTTVNSVVPVFLEPPHFSFYTSFKYRTLLVLSAILKKLVKHVFHFRMTSTIKYYKCEEIFAELPLWKAVPDSERKWNR